MVRRQMRVRDRGLKERSMKTCCERNAVDSSDFLVGYDGFQGIQLVASSSKRVADKAAAAIQAARGRHGHMIYQ